MQSHLFRQLAGIPGPYSKSKLSAPTLPGLPHSMIPNQEPGSLVIGSTGGWDALPAGCNDSRNNSSAARANVPDFLYSDAVNDLGSIGAESEHAVPRTPRFTGDERWLGLYKHPLVLAAIKWGSAKALKLNISSSNRSSK